jgi:peptidoglycan L-alanyl-D-glutamate endopeptidase CwlK
MAKFSKRSQLKLDSCHPDLQLICGESIKIFDYTVLEGARSDETQQEYFKQGRSKLDGILKRGKHQVTAEKPLSDAVDITPYPIDWKDKTRFFFLAGIMKGVALRLLEEGKITHTLRWGGDWDSDNDFKDQSFNDLPHFELIPIKKK